MEIYQTGVAHVSPPKQVVVDPHAEPLGVVFLLTVNGRALSQVKICAFLLTVNGLGRSTRKSLLSPG